jgi:hypothetical protein
MAGIESGLSGIALKIKEQKALLEGGAHFHLQLSSLQLCADRRRP